MTVSKDASSVVRDGRGVGAGTHAILIFPPNKLFYTFYS